MSPKEFLRILFETALEAATPKPEWFSGVTRPGGKTVVIGAGKAAASMASAFEKSWEGPLAGIVVTRTGHTCPTDRIEVIEAAHPVPDASSVAAAKRVLGLVQGLSSSDLVVALISGGGSSLLTLPAEGVTLEEKQRVCRELLRSGAPIGEMNQVRKAMSAIKGGKLLAACAPARVVSFILSDVPGDDPQIVASGPTVPSTSTPADALEVLDRYQISVSPSFRNHLESEQKTQNTWGEHEERIVGSSLMSLQSAAARAEELGVEARILSDSVQGESRGVAKNHGELALDLAEQRAGTHRPCVLLSGGETTVTVRGEGRGGRNVEFLAALAEYLKGKEGVYALAADTDGVDGMEETAGAMIDPTTLARAGDQLDRALQNNDAHTLFSQLGDAIVTGPTLTNVNDFRAILLTTGGTL